MFLVINYFVRYLFSSESFKFPNYIDLTWNTLLEVDIIKVDIKVGLIFLLLAKMHYLQLYAHILQRFWLQRR